MKTESALFHRDCKVSNSEGVVEPLTVTFYSPLENPHGDEYISRVSISCSFFNRDIRVIGEDAAQSFFLLPNLVVSYLRGRRRYGYEAYWIEKGDLDFEDFWRYNKLRREIDPD